MTNWEYQDGDQSSNRLDFDLTSLVKHKGRGFDSYRSGRYFSLISVDIQGVPKNTNRFDLSSKGPSSGISVTLIPDEGPLLETSNLFVSLR